MKPFNLEKALVGEPVVLRGGRKAFVLCDLKQRFKYLRSNKQLIGVVATENNSDMFEHTARWYDTGEYLSDDDGCESDYDITGMWEEPVKPQNKILEEAWQNRGKIVKTDAGMTTTVEVVGKTADGEYIVRNPVTGSLDEISTYGKLNWQPYEEPKGPVLNHNLAILHLPKPITPKEGEDYWRISKAAIGKLHVERARFSHLSYANRTHSEQGNCFASELDAQAWVNALDYARASEMQYEGLDKNS